jgi:putative redox protein
MDIIDEKAKWASAIIGEDLYKTNLILDSHTLIADEPIGSGGKDLGPSPGDFLRLSLASCTAITLRMYANRKGFDVKHIEVKVRTEQVAGKTVFHRHVAVKGNIDTQQRERLLQIANACPIHKTLTNPIEVLTRVS